MVAWMNQEALHLTRETGQAHFWSRSRATLWHKGETSGNVMNVREMRIDCDGDTLLLKVEPEGPACHTGQRSCFYRCLDPVSASSADKLDGRWRHGDGERRAEGGRPVDASAEVDGGILDELFSVILDRKARRPTGSYTAELFDAGEDEILKKVGEEAMEVVLAAKGEGDERVVSEIGDLVYHLLVLLAWRDLEPADVEAELAERRRYSGLEA